VNRPVALVLRALGLGDFFAGLPALHLLRAGLPDHRIVLALPEYLWPLARLSALVDDLTPARELDPLERAPRGADVALDLHGNGPASRDLLAATGAHRIVAFANGVPDWRADEHEVQRWLRLVADGVPVPELPWPPVAGSLQRTPDVPDTIAGHGKTVVHCGAKAPSRRWPAERFAALAAGLRAEAHDVLVVGGAAERELAAAIGAAAGVPVRTDLSVSELVALVARARLLVSGDTGPAHVASNYRVASVVLFGPVSPLRWGPPPDPRHQVIWHGDGTGDPHGASADPALLRITVDEVLDAVSRAEAAAAPVPR
jgi:ADP-heptose:LPS heptosyltransferase